MRRGGTGLVVLVVAAIALAAGIDALRGGGSETIGESEPPPPTTTTTNGDAPVEPALAGELGGTLYYTDESCELEAVALLRQSEADAPNWDECEFVLSPNGRRVSGAGTGWDPYSDPLIGRIFQSRDGTIQVSTNSGPQGEPFAGTAPAWRPDGTLTYFADGAVRTWPSGDVLLSQRELLAAVRDEGVPFRTPPVVGLSVREAAWLDGERLALIASTRIRPDLGAGQDMLVVYEGDRLATWRLFEQEDVSDLQASPGGNYLAARYGSDQLVILDRFGSDVTTPPLAGYRAIAWSPDDRWSAVATDEGVLVFRPGEDGPPDLELDLDTRDLDWRGGLGPGAVSGPLDTTEAASWLARVGVGGRLLVTQQEGEGCRLRALEIPTLEWAEAPDVPESPCRFEVDVDGNIVTGGVSDVVPTHAGRPTYVAGGELFAGNPGGRSELLVSAAKLEEIFGAPAALEEVSWLDEDRFWAVLRTEGADRIALMTTDARVFSPWFGAPRIEDLRVSASMVAARSDRGVAILDDGGRRRLIFTNGREVAWAPGELIAAISTRDGLLFVAPATGESVSLALEVADLEWVTQ